jgi:hypothetical protein
MSSLGTQNAGDTNKVIELGDNKVSSKCDISETKDEHQIAATLWAYDGLALA